MVVQDFYIDFDRKKTRLSSLLSTSNLCFCFCGCDDCRRFLKNWNAFYIKNLDLLMSNVDEYRDKKQKLHVFTFWNIDYASIRSFNRKFSIMETKNLFVSDPHAAITYGVFRVEKCPRLFVIDKNRFVVYSNKKIPYRSADDIQIFMATKLVITSLLEES
jgi:hypothetical protein